MIFFLEYNKEQKSFHIGEANDLIIKNRTNFKNNDNNWVVIGMGSIDEMWNLAEKFKSKYDIK